MDSLLVGGKTFYEFSQDVYSNQNEIETIFHNNSPWIKYNNTGWNAPLYNQINGEKWLIKCGLSENSHALNISGNLLIWDKNDYKQESTINWSPILNDEQQHHLGNKTYNIILLKWKHITKEG